MVKKTAKFNEDLNISIKEWYTNEFKSDKVGQTLSPKCTFLDLNNLLSSGKGEKIYKLLGGDADSLVRERCFTKLSELTGESYKTIYYKWLRFIEIEDNKKMELGI